MSARRPASGRDSGGDQALAPILAAVAAVPPGDWPAVIEQAYAVAAHWHRGRLRQSGEPYITHPVAVARILAEASADPAVLCAALLHDLPHDTGYTLAALRRDFGADIADLVDQAARLDGAACAALTDAGAASDQDRRALMLKLADRLHNMRTVRYLPADKQQRRSRETIDVFAPLARALALPAFERELAERAEAVLAAGSSDTDRPGPAGIGGGGAAGLLLAVTALTLPGPARRRWLEEWAGELGELPTRRGRARFALSMLAGMPAMAMTLRKHRPAQTRRPR